MNQALGRRICLQIRRFSIPIIVTALLVVGAGTVPAAAGTPLAVSNLVPPRQPLVVVSHRVPVTIEIDEAVSSRRARPGETFTYRVVDAVWCHGALVLPDGMEGTGTIASVRRAGKFGRDAKLRFHLGTVTAVDGTAIELGVPSGSSGPGENEGLAAGASLVGLAALGPLGLAGGALVKGDEVKLEQGNRLTAYPLRPVLVRGVIK